MIPLSLDSTQKQTMMEEVSVRVTPQIDLSKEKSRTCLSRRKENEFLLHYVSCLSSKKSTQDEEEGSERKKCSRT